MNYQRWSPGLSLTSPVYLDANILVGYTVSGHRLYRQCAQLVADILAAGVDILFSHVAYQEALWALARIAYANATGRREDTFTRRGYRNNHRRIFSGYSAYFTAVSSALATWKAAGVRIQAVPLSSPDWSLSVQAAADNMRMLEMEAGDAVHLALAASYAQTLVTADADFQRIAKSASAINITLVHVA